MEGQPPQTDRLRHRYRRVRWIREQVNKIDLKCIVGTPLKQLLRSIQLRGTRGSLLRLVSRSTKCSASIASTSTQVATCCSVRSSHRIAFSTDRKQDWLEPKHTPLSEPRPEDHESRMNLLSDEQPLIELQVYLLTRTRSHPCQPLSEMMQI